MSFYPKVTVSSGTDSQGEFTAMVFTWYKREVRDEILRTVGIALREGVKAHLLEDIQFRTQISEAIKIATATIPLDALTECVKKAIAANREAEKTS